MTQTSYCVVLVTIDSEIAAAEIARVLLEDKLAACINIMPIESFYIWQEEMARDREWQLFIKTRLDLFERLAVKIQEIHNYELPEIIALPIVSGSTAYLNWIGDNTISE